MIQRVVVHQNYTRVSLGEQFLDLGNEDLAFEMDFITQRISGANFLSSAIFACQRPVDAFVRLLRRLFCAEPEDISEFVQLFLEQNKPKSCQKSNYTLELTEATELVTLVLLHYRYFLKQTNQLVWILCDLPPGVGKSTEISRLHKILKGKLCIVTPTAKSAQVFSDELGARTLHSRFGLPLKTFGRSSAISASIDKYLQQNSGKDLDLYFFDEFSMYDPSYMVPLFSKLNKEGKMGIVCGDSCQMPPTRAAAKPYEEIMFEAGIKFCQCVPKIEHASDSSINVASSIQIKRLWHNCENSDWNEDACLTCARRKRLYEFILFLRKRIFQETASRHQNGKMQYELNFPAFSYCTKFFSDMQMKKLTMDDVIKEIVKIQNQVLDGNYKKLESTPCLLGYENKINQTALELVKSKCSFDTESNVLDGTKLMVPNIFVTEDSWLTNNQVISKSIQDDLSDSISLMALSKGMFIRCKENDAVSRTYNGQTAIFLGFVGVKDILIKRIPSLVNCAEYLVGFTAPDVKVRMKIFDLKSSSERLLAPMKKYCCDMCRLKKCIIHIAHPCFYRVFNWSVNYSCTIFALQGSTLRTEQVYLMPDLIFKNNILRTAYIIFSRVTDPKQLVLNREFALKLLQYIFGCSEAKLRNFIKRNNLLLPEQDSEETSAIFI